MTRRNWKRVRPSSFIEALRLCKEFAQDKHNLSVERIADRMGVSHDSLYKWLATGRMPGILIPAYELVCGCHFASTWLSSAADKLVIDMPNGRKVNQAEVLEVNTSCAEALQLLTAFYADPAGNDTERTLNALRTHLEQVAFHHANVQSYTNPQLEF